MTLVFTVFLLVCVVTSPTFAVDEPEILYDAARALLAAHRIDDALPILLGIADKHPRHALAPEALLLAGEAQLKLRRFAEAARVFGALASMPAVSDSARYRALAGAGLVREEQRDWCAAVPAYEAVSDHSPDPTLRDWAVARLRTVRAKLAARDGLAPVPSATSAAIPSGRPPGAVPFFDDSTVDVQCPDDAKALAESHRRRCEQGDPRACSSAGVLFEQPPLVPVDPQLAAHYYKVGCDGGDPLGCRRLGALYHRGVGVARRPARAADLYRRACDDGEALACANLAALYETGVGVTVDGAKAARLYRKACDLGARLVCGP